MFEIKKTEYQNKTFRFEKKLLERLAICASKNEISINELVSQCCKFALDNMKIDTPENQ